MILLAEARLAASILNDNAPSISQAEPVTASALDALVGRCLAKDPSERWQSISEVLLILRQLAKTAMTPSQG